MYNYINENLLDALEIGEIDGEIKLLASGSVHEI